MFSMEGIAGSAFKPGEIKQKERTMKFAWEVGQMMVACHKEGGKFPKEYAFPVAKIMSQKYGLPSVYSH
jgi:enoyl reductase-like protein